MSFVISDVIKVNIVRVVYWAVERATVPSNAEVFEKEKMNEISGFD